MEKNKKIIIGVISAIVVVALVIALICIVRQNINNTEKTSRLNKIYENIVNKGEYTFTEETNENNKITYVIKDDKAFVDSIYEGEESKYVVKDGNTYLIIDDEKTYYKYENNMTDLSVIPSRLKTAANMEFISGTENIENKNYYYEEFNGYNQFLITEDNTETSEIKTRFYFDGSQLVYIKTITKDSEELLKVNLTYKAQNQSFEIPSDYVEG